jgi:acyl carrier protein
MADTAHDAHLGAFVAGLERAVGAPKVAASLRDGAPLDLDSLDHVELSIHMASLGADLPPGIEDVVVTVHDLYEHACRRWGGPTPPGR